MKKGDGLKTTIPIHFIPMATNLKTQVIEVKYIKLFTDNQGKRERDREGKLKMTLP